MGGSERRGGLARGGSVAGPGVRPARPLRMRQLPVLQADPEAEPGKPEPMIRMRRSRSGMGGAPHRRLHRERRLNLGRIARSPHTRRTRHATLDPTPPRTVEWEPGARLGGVMRPRMVALAGALCLTVALGVVHALAQEITPGKIEKRESTRPTRSRTSRTECSSATRTCTRRTRRTRAWWDRPSAVATYWTLARVAGPWG